jgi:SAM-dependent methyltransferase
MISRGLKEAFYNSLSGPMRINSWLHRHFLAPKSGVLKVQLGPGQGKYLAGWCNVDANLFTAKIDVWADLRYRLPFRDNTVDVFYSHHVIEHLPDQLLPFHFGEMYRCLKPGGFIRVGGPNADAAMQQYLAGNMDWFGDFPDKRASLGGRFANFILCRGEHFTILTESYLAEIATNVGFQGVRRCLPITETHHPAMIDDALLSREFESTPDAPHTLLIEAEKPLNAS